MTASRSQPMLANLAKMRLALSTWAFDQLYTQWAGIYDLVAGAVSLGRWYDWVRLALPYLRGPQVLEIGPGTGHLLELLEATDGIHPIGLDGSKSMLRLARRRTGGRVALARGLAQGLPLPSNAFDTIVSTFPAAFIRDVRALREFRRVIRPGGRLLLLPVAQLVGASPLEKFVAWALATAGEAPRDSREALTRRLLPLLEQEGFQPDLHELSSAGSVVFLIVGEVYASGR